MKLLIDSADVRAIEKIAGIFPVDGVTTNPSILAKEKEGAVDALLRIREILGDRDLHVQALGSTAEEMIEDAEAILKLLGRGTIIKIPAVPEGYRAMRMLSKAGVRVTGTAVYTPMQGLLSAKAGASFVAPYVNRIETLGGDGAEVSESIQQMFEAYGAPCMVMAASFKSVRQVQELARLGIGAATLSPEVWGQLFANASVDEAVRRFEDDFAGAFGVSGMKELLKGRTE